MLKRITRSLYSGNATKAKQVGAVLFMASMISLVALIFMFGAAIALNGFGVYIDSGLWGAILISLTASFFVFGFASAHVPVIISSYSRSR